MSVRASTWAWEQGRAGAVKGGQLLTLLRIADHADNDGVCWPGERSLADYTGQGETTVRGHLKALEEVGLLHRERRAAEAGRGRAADRILLALDQPAEIAGDTEGVQPAAHDVSTGSSQHDQPAAHDAALYREPSKEPSENQTQGSVSRLFEVWRSETNRPRAQLTKGRRAKLTARLGEGYEPELIERAIRNVAHSPFHQGKNDRGRRFDELTMICASGERLEGYAELQVPGSGPKLHAVADVPDELAPADELWAEACDRLRGSLDESTFALWIKPLKPLGRHAGVVYLTAPDRMQLGWIERRYLGLIREALGNDGHGLEVRLIERPDEDESEAAA